MVNVKLKLEEFKLQSFRSCHFLPVISKIGEIEIALAFFLINPIRLHVVASMKSFQNLMNENTIYIQLIPIFELCLC